MHLLPPILFVVSANIDNFAVGVAYGIKKIKIGLFSSLIIAIVSAAGTFISMSFGLVISKCMPMFVSNILGSTILIGIGIWIIGADCLKKHKNEIQDTYNKNEFTGYIELLDHPEKADANQSGDIDVKESVTLAFALTINNIGLGIGASITGLNIVFNTIFTFIFSLAAVVIGCRLGNGCLSKLMGKFATLASGLIIIVLGVYQIII
jgi:putative sporulation protein YtaF